MLQQVVLQMHEASWLTAVVVAVDVIAVFEDEVVWEIDSWFICELL